MHAHGHTWGSHVSIGRTARGLTWLQRLRQHLAAYRAQHKHALLIRHAAGWHVRRDHGRTSTAASALEYAADQGGPTMSMTLYTAHTYMASGG